MPTKTHSKANGKPPNAKPPVPQIEAVKGETAASPQTKTLEWHGINVVLPDTLPAWWMFDVFEAQAGDDVAMVRAIYDIVGPDNWQKCRTVAKELELGQDEFNELIQQVLGVYGMSEGEPSPSTGSSATGGDS